MNKSVEIGRKRDAFEDARRRGKLNEAVEALRALERLEPDEPRWPHQQGEMYRRLGQIANAVEAYERASHRYSANGFVARAVAMAKTLVRLAPDRSDVLDTVDPSRARAVHRAQRPRSPSIIPGSVPLPERPPVSLAEMVIPLLPADDQEDDEIRFFDVDDDDVLELDITELEVVEEGPPSLPPDAPQSIERLALMPSFPLFAELPAEQLRGLAAAADLVELEDGVTVVERDEPADSLYCIVDGGARVELPGMSRVSGPKLGEGDIFGESCLLDGARRAATVRATGWLVALRIPRASLDELVEQAPSVGDVLFELLVRRLMGNLLKLSPLFAAFDSKTRLELTRKFELRRAKEGVTIIEAGKRSDGLYVVLNGTVEVTDSQGEVHAAGGGALFGQGSLLSASPSEITAKTTSECVVLRLPATRFSTFAALYPPALAHIADLAASPVEALKRTQLW